MAELNLNLEQLNSLKETTNKMKMAYTYLLNGTENDKEYFTKYFNEPSAIVSNCNKIQTIDIVCEIAQTVLNHLSEQAEKISSKKIVCSMQLTESDIGVYDHLSGNWTDIKNYLINLASTVCNHYASDVMIDLDYIQSLIHSFSDENKTEIDMVLCYSEFGSHIVDKNNCTMEQVDKLERQHVKVHVWLAPESTEHFYTLNMEVLE